MRKFLTLPLLLSLFSLAGFAQTITGYQSTTLVDNTVLNYRLYSDGTAVQVNRLPPDAVRSRTGIRRLVPYALEAKQQINLDQFGSNKYFDARYFFSIDFNTPQDNVAKRKNLGVSMFSRFVQPNQAEYNALPQSQKFYYQTENELHGPYEGAKYYESTLAEIEAHYNSVIPSGMNTYVPNIETSTEWNQWRYGSNKHGYDDWSIAQNRSIKCEKDGVVRTLGELHNSGQWEQEMLVRRANRNAIMATIALQRNTYFAYGSSMKQGEPRTNDLSNTAVFVGGSADVSHIGGSNGTITLNGRTYSGINKNVYAYENVMLDYYYYMDAFISDSDHNDIWNTKSAGTQTLPYIWSKLYPYHIVASEKGHWQANKYKMRNVAGQVDRPTIRMQEPFFEGVFFTPGFAERNSFMPFAEVQNIILADGYNYTPKVWLPPYYMYGAYVVHRFLEGATPGAGYHLFNAPGLVKTPTTYAAYNHHLHTIPALFQARNDMQPYERFFPGSTLVIDPEVQINQTGSWLAYSGCDAFAFGPDGSRGVQKPAYILRFLPTASGWQVVIVGGTNQNWTQEHTDLIRVPNGGLNGNLFRVKTRGPGAHIFEFSVNSADSNQIYDALPQAQTLWEKAGYSGRIGSAQN